MEIEDQQKRHMIDLAFTKMPFGKYQGYFLSDIPEPYYVWFRQKGFPDSKIGRQIAEMYEIKLNGLESIFYKIRRETQIR